MGGVHTEHPIGSTPDGRALRVDGLYTELSTGGKTTSVDVSLVAVDPDCAKPVPGKAAKSTATRAGQKHTKYDVACASVNSVMVPAILTLHGGLGFELIKLMKDIAVRHCSRTGATRSTAVVAAFARLLCTLMHGVCSCLGNCCGSAPPY
jgi:hypothetical protein